MYNNVVFLTGAGTSVSAGIPDYRTLGTGVYHNLEKYGCKTEAEFNDISYFIKNPKPFYQSVKVKYFLIFC